MHQTMKTWINSNIKKKLESEGLFIAFWLRKTDIPDISIFSFYCYFIREPHHMFQRSISWKKVVFRPIKMISQLSLCLPLVQEAHHRFRIKRNQLFGTTNNLLMYFEWANADEEVFICLLKEVLVIVARRMLSKRNISCCWLPQYKKKETSTEKCRQQSSLAVEHKRKHLENC